MRSFVLHAGAYWRRLGRSGVVLTALLSASAALGCSFVIKQEEELFDAIRSVMASQKNEALMVCETAPLMLQCRAPDRSNFLLEIERHPVMSMLNLRAAFHAPSAGQAETLLRAIYGRVSTQGFEKPSLADMEAAMRSSGAKQVKLINGVGCAVVAVNDAQTRGFMFVGPLNVRN